MESDEELPLAAAWEEVKRTRITGLSALEDAQSALASLGAVASSADVVRGNNNDHRRHPAVLRLLSQCPFPQLAAYVLGSRSSYASSKKAGGNISCFPPAGGKSARGAAAADRRLSDACGVLLRGAEAAERAAKEACELFDSINNDLEDLLAATEGEEGIEGLPLKAAAEEDEGEGEGDSSGRGDDDVETSPLSAAVSVSIAAAADALELLAKVRRAVAGGKSEGLEDQKVDEDKEEKLSSSPSSVSTPPVSPWSFPEHLHSYAIFWDLAPFAEDVGNIEVALAVERARWKRKKRKEAEVIL